MNPYVWPLAGAIVVFGVVVGGAALLEWFNARERPAPQPEATMLPSGRRWVITHESLSEPLEMHGSISDVVDVTNYLSWIGTLPTTGART